MSDMTPMELREAARAARIAAIEAQEEADIKVAEAQAAEALVAEAFRTAVAAAHFDVVEHFAFAGGGGQIIVRGGHPQFGHVTEYPDGTASTVINF